MLTAALLTGKSGSNPNAHQPTTNKRGIIIRWTITQLQTGSTNTTCNMDGPYSTLC